ncbi:DsbA family oxidoreductase [Angustibacter sp. McL0619]|uniref:DsbA family oxidoreductase n=1 Tax=Angustibacter sp. McL0619 TaxID=3415676 RepID=UPI003CEFB6EA
MSEALQVEIWSDVVCPWCYIGKRRFEAGAAASGVPVHVTWRSFQLDPSAPRESTEDVATYLGRKYGGGRENGLVMNARVSQIAAEDGLDYHLDEAKRANTVDAHRLLHLAAEHGVQDALKERLLSAYFVEALAVGDHDVLARLATEAGLPEQRVRQVLDSQEYAADVETDQREAAELGANGVPFFVIDRKYGVSGAQPSELFEQALKQAWDERRPSLVTPVGAVNAGSAEAEVCGPDGC